MVTEVLIKFTSKKAITVRGDTVGWLSMLLNSARPLGYFIGHRQARWIDASDRHVLWGKWTMTGSDAVDHLLNRDERFRDEPCFEGLKESLACEPEVTKLRASEENRSCRCKVADAPPLALWCTPSTCAPALLCDTCRLGVIATYRLHLSRWTCILMEQWQTLAAACYQLSSVQNAFAKDTLYDFIQSQRHPQSSLQRLGSDICKLVKQETGREVVTRWPPYNIVRL